MIIFSLDYTSYSGKVFDSTFSLRNSGEELILKDSFLTEVDKVNYTEIAPSGYSMELIDYVHDNNDMSKWISFTPKGTPVNGRKRP